MAALRPAEAFLEAIGNPAIAPIKRAATVLACVRQRVIPDRPWLLLLPHALVAPLPVAAFVEVSCRSGPVTCQSPPAFLHC